MKEPSNDEQVLYWYKQWFSMMCEADGYLKERDEALRCRQEWENIAFRFRCDLDEARKLAEEHRDAWWSEHDTGNGDKRPALPWELEK